MACHFKNNKDRCPLHNLKMPMPTTMENTVQIWQIGDQMLERKSCKDRKSLKTNKIKQEKSVNKPRTCGASLKSSDYYQPAPIARKRPVRVPRATVVLIPAAYRPLLNYFKDQYLLLPQYEILEKLVTHISFKITKNKWIVSCVQHYESCVHCTKIIIGSVKSDVK